jgi:hypothetical protein
LPTKGFRNASKTSADRKKTNDTDISPIVLSAVEGFLGNLPVGNRIGHFIETAKRKRNEKDEVAAGRD